MYLDGWLDIECLPALPLLVLERPSPHPPTHPHPPSRPAPGCCRPPAPSAAHSRRPPRPLVPQRCCWQRAPGRRRRVLPDGPAEHAGRLLGAHSPAGQGRAGSCSHPADSGKGELGGRSVSGWVAGHKRGCRLWRGDKQQAQHPPTDPLPKASSNPPGPCLRPGLAQASHQCSSQVIQDIAVLSALPTGRVPVAAGQEAEATQGPHDGAHSGQGRRLLADLQPEVRRGRASRRAAQLAVEILMILQHPTCRHTCCHPPTRPCRHPPAPQLLPPLLPPTSVPLPGPRTASAPRPDTAVAAPWCKQSAPGEGGGGQGHLGTVLALAALQAAVCVAEPPSPFSSPTADPQC